MKTSIKILLLILFSVAAVAAVLVFAKTRVAPPVKVATVDQYSMDLQEACDAYDGAGQDFNRTRGEYKRLDDRLNLFLAENVIDAGKSDEFRMVIDEKYGDALETYSFAILEKSVWPEDRIREMLGMLKSLGDDRLSTGAQAAPAEFVESAARINKVIDDYRVATQLSRQTSFNGIANAAEKIRKAREYASAQYLSNNTALTAALDQLPRLIAQSHYGHVNRLVNSLAGYRGMSRDSYMEHLVPQVDDALEEYRKTNIYGGVKPPVGDLEERAMGFIEDAADYYDGDV